MNQAISMENHASQDRGIGFAITEEYSISGSTLTIADEEGYPMEYTKTK